MTDPSSPPTGLTRREKRERSPRRPKGGLPPYQPLLAILLVRSGALAGERLALRKPLSTIGRAGHNDLELPDSSVGSFHARIEVRQGIWFLTPLGTDNLTRLDDEVVTEETPLCPGSTIQFGNVAVLFEPRDLPEVRPGGRPRTGPATPPKGPSVLRRILLVLLVLAGALLLLALWSGGLGA